MRSLRRIQPLEAVAPATPAEATDHHPTTSTLLHLSRLPFTLVWIAYVCVGTLNATLTMIFAAIYYGAYSIRGGNMIESVGLMDLENIPIVIGCYAIVSLLFWKLLIQAIVGSMRNCRLVFASPSQVHSATQKPRILWYQRLYQAVMKRLTFQLTFLMREIVEVVTQSYQVYKCSTLISMAWINDFYVATLVINCWIAPIIHVRLHHNPPLQKFLYITSDIVLDFASTFVVPVVIISTIVVAAFEENMRLMSGAVEYAFDVPMRDVPFMNMIKAVQQVFVVTWLDVFTKLLPFVSMASCLVQIKHFVHRSPTEHNTTAAGQIAIKPRRSLVERIRPRRRVRTAQEQQLWRREKRSRGFSIFTIHAVFAVWGVCMMAFHLHATSVWTSTKLESVVGCKSSSQPWFVSKLSCTILEINCYRREFTGDAREIASALDTVDASGIASLIISHCPKLYMPAQLQTLSNLMWLEVYNATLMGWDEHAALINSKMPALQYLNLLRINMTELPMGVQSSQFPRRLRDITIALSNLTTLPTDLHTKWTRMVNLVLERNHFDAIPWTVAEMNPSRLSVFDNQITSIPPDFFTRDANFWILSIAKNPVTAWPEAIGTLDRIYEVLIDYTEISELPLWLIEEGNRRATAKDSDLTVSAGGSPFCRQRLSRQSEVYPGLRVVCREKDDLEIEAYMMSFFQPDRMP